MSEPELSPAQFQRDLNVNAYINLVSFTLLYYEYLITFEAEVTRIWAHTTLNTPTVIFYLNRYVTLFGHIPIVVQYFWTAPGSDFKREYYAVLIQIMVGVMLIARTYALYERNKKILTGLVLFTVGAIIHGGWAVYTAKSDERHEDPVPYIGCPSSVGASLGERLAAAWLGMLIFDTIVFILTLYKALRIGRVRGNLLPLLVRDGTLYYGVMISCNLGNILTFFLGDRIIRGLLTTFTNVMASILISRLVLNLRDPRILQATPNSTTVYSRPSAPTLSTLEPNTIGSAGTPFSSFWRRTRSQTTKTSQAGSSIFMASSSGLGDQMETSTRLGQRGIEDRIDEESIREEAIELTEFPKRSPQEHV
ncbi:hypothetical protein V5O48_011021 [Marasmius crinis-equi]|uniref:DUF6533 domain-containing protein n=1 Tax=Marasmius crinis-equi TaxID=585013 RepID=A0ABR3F6Q8_9AGAR